MNAGDSEETPRPPAVDQSIFQCTVRAVLTGMILGGVLSLCNLYTGLKIGLVFNMSVAATLLSYGLYRLSRALFGTRPWSMLENNINQTAASSGASIASAGLVAPIPALTLLTGRELSWAWLSVWIFSVSLVGIVVAVSLRRQMLVTENLTYPGGVIAAETLKQLYAQGRSAAARVWALVGGVAAAAAAKLAVKLGSVPMLYSDGGFAAGALQAKGLARVSLKNLTFALNPSLLIPAVGALIGMRACASLLAGAVIAWGIIAPYGLEVGWMEAPVRSLEPAGVARAAGAMWYKPLMKWLLWPGVTMMVTASLTSFAFSWRAVVASLSGSYGGAETAPSGRGREVTRRALVCALVVVLLLSVACQVALFDIHWGVAVSGVLLTFLLAVVAARVAGETGVTPVGSMGKVTQLTFGVIAPGDVTANLMAANVAGGAASQCADLMADLKTGLLIGASPRLQALAQVFGALAGSLVGTAAYLLLIPDPAKMLGTKEWAAPAVTQWKAVAEVVQRGLSDLPPGCLEAAAVAGGLGVVLAVLEKVLPRRAARFVPSPASLGLSFVLPAFYSLSFFMGGLAAYVASRAAPRWSSRYLVVLAAGLIVG